MVYCGYSDTKEIIPKGNIGILIVATSIGSIGNIALSFLPIYFTSLGGTVLQYGIITTFATLIGIPSTISGGIISGRHSLKKIAILTSWIGPVILLGYYLSNSWTVLSIPILIGTTGAISSTAWRQLVADATVQKNRTAQLSVYQTLTTMPLIFAPLVGGYLVHTMGVVDGFRLGVLVSLAISPVSTILLVKFLREKDPKLPHDQQVLPHDTKKQEPLESVFSHSRDFWSNLTTLPRPLVPLLSAYVLVIIANSTTSPYLIFYGITVAKLDSFQWGIILSIQILFANLVRTPLGIVSDRFDKRKMLFLSVITTAPLSIFLILEHSFLGILAILLAMIATGVSYGPTHEALQIELTPRTKRPALFAVYDTLRNVSVSAGTIIGAILFTINYTLPFYSFTITEVCAGAIIACAFFLKPGKPRSVTTQQKS
ncbi:MAG: MFS transporter [Thaumarchaeota archaeon]|nr:MFS transporter [Nitrososphaerota archaeon]